jgi:hypothetical protein
MRSSKQRGSALLTAAALTTVLLLVVAGLMYYASRSRSRAVAISRGSSRISCAESGLQLARAYYGRNYAFWNSTFLPNPAVYNATVSTARTTSFQTANPQLFADLDGDGQPDVYLYIHDNYDEFLPNVNNPNRDNDLNVIVGSACISGTLLPRAESGYSSSAMISEGLLSYNPTGSYGSQGYQGASGSGNLNSEN